MHGRKDHHLPRGDLRRFIHPKHPVQFDWNPISSLFNDSFILHSLTHGWRSGPVALWALHISSTACDNLLVEAHYRWDFRTKAALEDCALSPNGAAPSCRRHANSACQSDDQIPVGQTIFLPLRPSERYIPSISKTTLAG